MERAVFVYTTYPSIVEAEKAGRALIDRKVAACVNILPGMISLYRWEGKVEDAREWLLIVKTTAGAFGEVREAIAGLHSYDVPECICVAIEDGAPGYLEWIGESVRTESTG